MSVWDSEIDHHYVLSRRFKPDEDRVTIGFPLEDGLISGHVHYIPGQGLTACDFMTHDRVCPHCQDGIRSYTRCCAIVARLSRMAVHVEWWDMPERVFTDLIRLRQEWEKMGRPSQYFDIDVHSTGQRFDKRTHMHLSPHPFLDGHPDLDVIQKRGRELFSHLPLWRGFPKQGLLVSEREGQPKSRLGFLWETL